MNPRFFDAHSHIQFSAYDADRVEVVGRMKDAGVAALVVGTDRESSEKAIETVALWPEGLRATAGFHPTDADTQDFDATWMRDLAKDKNIVAIGECGIDYFRPQHQEENIKKREKEILEQQMEIAIENDLPLMLHARPSRGTMDAYNDMLEILEARAKAAGERLRGNVHFFVGDTSIARRFLNLGFTLSFTGVITFAHDYDDAVRYAPLDMLLSETDCPFVVPVPYRGKRNEPVYVQEIVKAIARIRDDDHEKVRSALARNALKAYPLGSRPPAKK